MTCLSCYLASDRNLDYWISSTVYKHILANYYLHMFIPYMVWLNDYIMLDTLCCYTVNVDVYGDYVE